MLCSYIQYNVSRNINDNLLKIEKMINKKKSSLYLLPEMSITGYLFDNQEIIKKYIAEIKENKIDEYFLELSSKYKSTIIYNIPVLKNYNIYNTSIIVSNGNYIGSYNKIHLTDYEKKFFIKGNEIKVFEIDNIKIGLQICFDVWFCEISRQQILNGADILCVSGNFGGMQTYYISKSRAIENAVPVLLCNRVGYEYNNNIKAEFIGKSALFNKNGEEVGKSVKNKERIEVQEIDISNNKSNIICRDMLKEIKNHY